MYGKKNGRIVTASLSACFFFAMAVLALAVFAPMAQAEERVCRGTIGATTVDNLRVPQGATCTLNGTKVEGTVKVERNASSPAASGSRATSRARASRTSRSGRAPWWSAACSSRTGSMAAAAGC